VGVVVCFLALLYEGRRLTLKNKVRFKTFRDFPTHIPLPIILGNALFKCLHWCGCLTRSSISFDRLHLDAVKRKKDGFADFGEPSYREALKNLIQSLHQDGNLSYVGDRMMAYDLGVHLEKRLNFQQEWAKNPQILLQTIENPIFIIGLPRSGTTLLHSLLAQDPNFQIFQTYEATYPTMKPESALKKTRLRYKMVNWLIPGACAFHDLRADAPEECIVPLGATFFSQSFPACANVPSYWAWARKQDWTCAYSYHQNILKFFQYRHKHNGSWLLKAPLHMFFIDTIMKVFPGAKFIWLHRDPTQAVPSYCSLVGFLRSIVSDKVDPQLLGPQTCELLADAINSAMRVRSTLGQSQELFLDVQYEDLMKSPMECLSRVYKFLGRPLEERVQNVMKSYLANNKQYSNGQAVYTLDMFGLDRQFVQTHFHSYLKQFFQK